MMSETTVQDIQADDYVTIRATFDQFENDGGGDYGIVNVYLDGSDEPVAYDVWDCDGFNIVEAVEFLGALTNVTMRQEPFNPYADGLEWSGDGYTV